MQNRSSEKLLHRAMLARLENLECLEKMVKKDLLVPKDTLDLQEHKGCLVDLEEMCLMEPKDYQETVVKSYLDKKGRRELMEKMVS